MKKSFILLLSVSSLILAACGGGNDEDIQPDDLSANANANDTTVDASCGRWEIPHLQSQYDYITHYLTDGTLNYALEYSPTKYHSHWVAYRYDSKTAQQNTQRTDAWAAEPYYKNQKQYQLAVSFFNGYQRGHILGSAERYASQEANKQTFYMSNMSPQIGAFNDNYWGTVEDLVRDQWGRKVASGDTLYVVKGGTIIDNQIFDTRVTAKNTQGKEVQVVIPKYYFAACLMRTKDGNCKAIGFIMEHKDYQISGRTKLNELRLASTCSIDDLEKKTGIDFFCNVPDKVENYVESTCNTSAWSGLIEQ